MCIRDIEPLVIKPKALFPMAINFSNPLPNKDSYIHFYVVTSSTYNDHLYKCTVLNVLLKLTCVMDEEKVGI